MDLCQHALAAAGKFDMRYPFKKFLCCRNYLTSGNSFAVRVLLSFLSESIRACIADGDGLSKLPIK